MIASLPMYDRPELAWATDRLWQLIRAELSEKGIHAPLSLVRAADYRTVWLRDDLLLSQTCSLPFRTVLAGRVHLVGTPDCGLRDCPAGYYQTILLARANDDRQRLPEFHSAVLAFNSTDSQSGWAAPLEVATEHRISFRGLLESGCHRGSVEAVANGLADLAGVDVFSWRQMQKLDHFARRVRVVGQSRCTPGLPLITARQDLIGQLFSSVETAISKLNAAEGAVLPFRGLIRIPEADYLSLPIPPSESSLASYAGLRLDAEQQAG